MRYLIKMMPNLKYKGCLITLLMHMQHVSELSLCFNQVLEVSFPTNYFGTSVTTDQGYIQSTQNSGGTGYSINPRNTPILKNCLLISEHCYRGPYEVTDMKTFCKL